MDLIKVKVLDTPVSVLNLQDAKEILQHIVRKSGSRYCCFVDLSVLVATNASNELKSIIASSYMAVPDGKPVQFALHLKGYKKAETISGFWLIQELLKTSYSHYFYGGDEQTLELLQAYIVQNYPDANVLGFKNPPFFVSVSDIPKNPVLKQDIQDIRKKNPDFIWIGISSPKQDYLMSYAVKEMSSGMFMGVGAVFDYLAGTHRISPEWIKKIGFRWLYRLLQDPKRLWKKYYTTMVGVIKYLMIKFSRLFF
jgi:N-acetylglucosaminyldiphosphoundecaprenol N-acetyl-beta-D-mannosaminyltransferase